MYVIYLPDLSSNFSGTIILFLNLMYDVAGVNGRRKKSAAFKKNSVPVIFSVVFRKNSGKSFFLPLTPAQSYLWN